MTDETREWDFLTTSSEVRFCDLKPCMTYKFILPAWFEDLNRQYHMAKDNIHINAISIGIQKIEIGEIADSQKIVLCLWRAVYDKWKRAAKGYISEKEPVIIELVRINKDRKWAIISIKEVDSNAI